MGFHNTALIGASGQGGYNLESSLRFRPSAGAYLERTFGVPTDPKKYTISVWAKRGALGGYQNIISAFDGVTTYPGSILFAPDDTLGCYMGGAAANAIITTQVFRDPSAWYHIVFSVDAANTTCSLQINGGVTTTATIANVVSQINANGRTVRIGDYFNGAAAYHFDGYLTEFNFIDGQVLTANDFGETNTITGVWKPKEYTGTYGTNGFYLPFTGEITPTVTAGFGGTAENVLYDDTNYLISNTTTGSGFDLVEYDFGESINMIDYNIQDFRFTGGVSTFKIYTSDVGGSLSNYTERASLSVSSSYQNYSGNLGVTARYIKIRATAFGTNGQGQINYFNVDVDSSVFSDNSGNANNWTPNNINLVTDIMNDVPTLTDEDTANFCTWNATAVGIDATLSNGNLDCAYGSSTGTRYGTPATIGMSSGKWYWEIKVTASSLSGTTAMIAITNKSNPIEIGQYAGVNNYGWAYYGQGTKVTNDVNVAYGATYTTGDVIGVSFDADAGNLVFYKNGVSQGTAFTGLTNGPYFPAIGDGSFTHTFTVSANFGQRPFAYTPPTGYKKLNTYNLPDSTIVDGSKYMNPVLYTGNGGTNAITTGFSPDLVWLKNRGSAQDNTLFDSIRGTEYYLITNWNGAESTDGNSNHIAYDSNGFTLTGTNARTNASSNSYVAWNWRGSDSSPVTNTDGTITSTVSANTDSGFSIVTYIGTAAVATVGHGLGVAPSMIITKNRDTTTDWWVYHSALGNTKYVVLNTTAVVATSSVAWNNTSPTSTVFTLGGAGNPSNANQDVAYCFAEVEGFSKFGSYINNASTDGPFVYLGFRPAFVMIKYITSGASDWMIFDSARDPYNVIPDYLRSNLSNAETTKAGGWIDFISNGFKVRNTDATTASINFTGGTGTFIYMAFAETPFKNSLAR